MEASSPKQISQLLVAWGNGDQGALQELMSLVYRELRRLAAIFRAGPSVMRSTFAPQPETL